MVPTDLIDLLLQRASTMPHEEAFVFDKQSVTYGQLVADALRITGYLQSLGIGTGDRVVVVAPNGPHFFSAFYGTLFAGGTAVPLFHDSGAERIAAIADLCDASAVALCDPKKMAGVQQAGARPAFLIADAGGAGEPVSSDPDAVAFLQYTSGSTGDPKGVQLTHRTLLANVQQMIAGMHLTPQDVFVSWLPVYHDMGLILMTMAPFYLKARLILLPTSLARINVWLQAIQDYKGSFTAAPDFAYRLCQRYVRNPGDYDLSSLRMCLNAAEPVRAATIEGFHNTFGLGPVSAPAYGLAEATVGVCAWPPGTPIKVDEHGLVSVGRPFPGITISIIDEAGNPCAAGEVGEILLQSPAACAGYYGNEAADSALFSEDGAVHTGDLGYLDASGDLFISGRAKNVIIAAGRTIAPQEVEETADRHPEVRLSAALGIDRGGIEGEQVYLFAELRRSAGMSQEALEDLEVALVGELHTRLGFRPGRVYLLKAKTIPRTPNGKLRHALLKQQYLAGDLRHNKRIVFPEY